jgi:hypothetical protein
MSGNSKPSEAPRPESSKEVFTSSQFKLTVVFFAMTVALIIPTAYLTFETMRELDYARAQRDNILHDLYSREREVDILRADTDATKRALDIEKSRLDQVTQQFELIKKSIDDSALLVSSVRNDFLKRTDRINELIVDDVRAEVKKQLELQKQGQQHQ